MLDGFFLKGHQTWNAPVQVSVNFKHEMRSACLPVQYVPDQPGLHTHFLLTHLPPLRQCEYGHLVGGLTTDKQKPKISLKNIFVAPTRQRRHMEHAKWSTARKMEAHMHAPLNEYGWAERYSACGMACLRLHRSPHGYFNYGFVCGLFCLKELSQVILAVQLKLKYDKRGCKLN